MVGGFDLIYRGKEMSIGNATSYTTMLGCKNNRIDNLKKLARVTAFRLAKEFQEKNKVNDSSKKIENKFTIKTSTKIDKGKIPQKTVIDSRKRNSPPTQTSTPPPPAPRTPRPTPTSATGPTKRRRKRKRKSDSFY